MAPVLKVDDCSLIFNKNLHSEVRALDSVRVELDAGEHLVIVGSNGAGKSTLLNLVSGRYIPDTGRVFLSGRDVTAVPEHTRARRIGRVFQDPLAGTAGPMTVAENLALAARRSTGRRFRRVRKGQTRAHREQLARLGMGLENRLDNVVQNLSGGQRQALALLMAATSEPELLILDEHTAALDPSAAERVLGLTTELVQEEGLTTLMITHNMEHAVSVGNRTVMMDRGKVLFDVAGAERDAMTVMDLVERFRSLQGTVSDRTALG